MPTDPRARRRTLAVTVAAVLVVGVGGVLALRDGGRPAVLSESCTASADGTSHALAPDQAANAALLTATAIRRGLPARAATIAIATAVQESKLRNIDYGDRDSLGLFQQRPSQGWGTPEQIMDPAYATDTFYDALVEVEGYESMEITVAAQRVQRSGFPEAYADHEPEGRAYASALTGNSPASLTCRLRPPADDVVQEPSASGLTPRADAVLTAAQTQLGELVAEPAGDDGATVAFTVDGEQQGRDGWALAHWAVAGADRLGVVSVATDGQRWDRTANEGWTPTDGAPPAGSVTVTVANGT